MLATGARVPEQKPVMQHADRGPAIAVGIAVAVIAGFIIVLVCLELRSAERRNAGRMRLTPPARGSINASNWGTIMLQRATHSSRRVGALWRCSTGSSFAQDTAPHVASVIHAGRLLADPASGRVLTQQTILVARRPHHRHRSRLHHARAARRWSIKNRFVLPGLIDSHVHLTSEQGPDSRIDEFTLTPTDGACAARLRAHHA